MFDLNSHKIDSIDHDKLSRQIRTYGIEITKILSKLKILIVGLRGYGVEIAKNIILSNPYQVSIFDENICKINDLGCNFFLSNENVLNKERRDEACLNKLAELNPTTKVTIENNYLSNIKNYDVVIITEIMNSNVIKKINKECHDNNKGFIYTLSFGLFSFAFSDFGEKHIILDKTGKEKGKFYISNITKEQKGKIKIDYSSTEKRLNSSGYLLFKNVEGMTELNVSEPRYYENNPENNEEFFIGDTSNYNEYKSGGIVEEFFYPVEMKYQTFEDNLMNPTDKMPKFDYSANKIGRKQLLHILFINFQNYFDKYGQLPELNNEEQSNELYNNIIEFSKKIDKNNEFFKELPEIENNEKLIKDICKFSRAQHPSLCSFLGGFVAQEAIKFTGLYCPLNQWLWFDIYDETIINLKNPNRTLLNNRYDDLISIYGQEFVERLHELNMFLIGAGAVGCEYLKILALMGVATKNNSKVTVTDNDCIENSNLNRQFLFRKEHIGKSKSLIASEQVKKINPEFNCESLQIEVREETENILDETFYKKQKFVLIAVDNIKARNYISNQCTFHGINLIECGTLGVNASSQLIVPFVSEEYKGTERKRQVGMCTLRNLPSLIEHCIEWSRDKFFEYFGNNIRLLKNFIENPNEFFKSNKGADLYEKLLYLKVYFKIFKSKSYDKCLNLGKKLFYLNYKKIINDTLKINPPDKILENGSKFWKGSNRLPHILEYNPDDETNFYYIEYFAYLLSDSLNIPYNNDINYKKEFLKKNEIYENDELFTENKITNNFQEQLKNLENLKSELIKLHTEGFDKNEVEKIHEQIFEKDHDDNHQIDFIYISSNLRASNFNIDFGSRDKVKFIAGNIVPSISTTTASIVGFISTQIYTLLQTTDINLLRQINIDLSTPFFLIYKPKKPYKNKDTIHPETKILTKVIIPDFTCWDYIEIEGNKTVDELLDFINEKYQIETTGLYTLSSKSIIENESAFNLQFQEAYYNVIGKKKEDGNSNHKSIYFKILADEKDNENIHIKMPKFKYIIE